MFCVSRIRAATAGVVTISMSCVPRTLAARHSLAKAGERTVAKTSSSKLRFLACLTNVDTDGSDSSDRKVGVRVGSFAIDIDWV